MFSAGKASEVARPCTTKEELALRKKNERARTTKLLARLELLAPIVDEYKTQPGHRSKALRGREKLELLKDVMHAVCLAQGLRSDALHSTPTPDIIAGPPYTLHLTLHTLHPTTSFLPKVSEPHPASYAP